MEIRGIWLTNVDSQVLSSRDRIAEAMEFLAKTGFNVVFPVVWNKGVTLYPSQVMQDYFDIAIDPIYGDRDPLAELIAEAHRVGLQVMPWFEYGFAASYQQNGGRILAQRPLWSGMDVNGKLLTKNGFVWMNALEPEVQDFLLSLVLEVVKNYDIDGIQGDDRMPAFPVEGGYDPKTSQRYRLQTNQLPPMNCREPRWVEWRANILTNFLVRLYREVKAIKSELIISMAPGPYKWGLDEYLQDSKSWVNLKIVDWLHPQLYRRQFWRYKLGLDQMMQEQFNSQTLSMLVPGVLIKSGSYQIRTEDLLRVIDYHRFLGIRGEVLFFYEGLRMNNDALAKALREGPYSVPAPQGWQPPPQNWSLIFMQDWLQNLW